MSTGDSMPALDGFPGSAAGRSSTTITRPTRQRTDHYDAFYHCDLSGEDYAQAWVGGISFNCGWTKTGCACLPLSACAQNVPKNWTR